MIAETDVRRCTHCSRPLSQAFICWDCAKMMGRKLAEVPWLLRRLTESAYGEAKTGRRPGARVSTGERLPSLPLNERAAGLLREAAQLARWKEQVDGDPTGVVSDPDACEGAARWLASQVGRAMLHPWAGDALAWLYRWIDDATKAVDLPPDMQYAGPCQEWRTQEIASADGQPAKHVRTGRCGTALYVEADTDIAECPACGARWPVSILQGLMLQRVDETPRTAAEMWRLFKLLGRDVPRSSFYKLMAEVEAVSVPDDGLPLYAYTAVAAALDERDRLDAERKAAGKARRGRPPRVKVTANADVSTAVC